MKRIILIIIIAFNFSFTQGIANLSADEQILALGILFGFLLWWAYSEGIFGEWQNYFIKNKPNIDEEE
tara:strand:- start:199 stop:402 length:204 start_codon:yes stop_codon:yes gene_type:complete